MPLQQICQFHGNPVIDMVWKTYLKPQLLLTFEILTHPQQKRQQRFSKQSSWSSLFETHDHISNNVPLPLSMKQADLVPWPIGREEYDWVISPLLENEPDSSSCCFLPLSLIINKEIGRGLRDKICSTGWIPRGLNRTTGRPPTDGHISSRIPIKM